MAFTASHYLEVAEIIRNNILFVQSSSAYATKQERDLSVQSIHTVRCGLAQMFSRQNPKFDAARFARDCTPEGST